MLPLCVLVHVWCNDDGVCKDGSKVAVGCNVTLIGTGPLVWWRLQALVPQSAGNTARELWRPEGWGQPVSAAPRCVLVHVWCSDDDGVCKDGSKMGEGCNVTLIGTGVVVVAGTCPTISWRHCPRALAT